MKINDTEITDHIIREGENIRITIDPETKQVILSAPTLNQSRLKHGAFVVSGSEVEIVAGSNIKITTASPNRITIGADFGKETARIVALEERLANLEAAIAVLIPNEH